MNTGLPDLAKRRILVALACFRSPAEVSAMMREDYGIEMEESAIDDFNAAALQSYLGRELRLLFDEARAAYLEDAVRANAEHRAWRLVRLQSMSEAAEAKGDLRLAARLIEQAARDPGLACTCSGKAGVGRRREAARSGEARGRMRAWLEEEIGAQSKGKEKGDGRGGRSRPML